MTTIGPLQCPSRLATAKAIYKRTGNRTLVFMPSHVSLPSTQGKRYPLREGLSNDKISQITGIKDYVGCNRDRNIHDHGFSLGGSFGDYTPANTYSVNAQVLHEAIAQNGIPNGFNFYRPEDPCNLQWQDIMIPKEHKFRYQAAAVQMMLARVVAEECDGEPLFRTRIGLALEGLPRENQADMLSHYLTALFGVNRDYDLAKDLATIVAIELNPLRQGRMGDQAEFLEKAGFKL